MAGKPRRWRHHGRWHRRQESFDARDGQAPEYLKRPGIDRTGLIGKFDFKFQHESMEDDISSILFSVQQIGLKLESGKGPVETIVIDSVEKPSGN